MVRERLHRVLRALKAMFIGINSGIRFFYYPIALFCLLSRPGYLYSFNRSRMVCMRRS
jgi:hypothetical protein